jgi:hypothetical protein
MDDFSSTFRTTLLRLTVVIYTVVSTSGSGGRGLSAARLSTPCARRTEVGHKPPFICVVGWSFRRRLLPVSAEHKSELVGPVEGVGDASVGRY